MELAYKQIRIFSQPSMNDSCRRLAIQEDRKPAISFFSKMGKGEIIHFTYIPADAYTKNGCKHNGLIVDLQEICSLDIQDAVKVQSPGIDFLLLSQLGELEQRRLKDEFFLETENDFVVLSDNITSLWIEYLMQRFSHTFIRIGVDGATKSDYSMLVENI